jgi:hypothetical protein
VTPEISAGKCRGPDTTPTPYRDAVALQSELTGIIAKAATEGRELSDNAKSRVAEIQTKAAEHAAAAVDHSEGRRAFLAGVTKTERKPGLVLKAAESLADYFKACDDETQLSLAEFCVATYLANGTGPNWSARRWRRAPWARSSRRRSPTRSTDPARNGLDRDSRGAATVPMTTAKTP